MKEKLEEIKNVGLKKIENVTNISELEEVRKELTGKKSLLSEHGIPYGSLTEEQPL